MFFFLLEHGGHHGHSHGLTSTHNKLAQLGNDTDDNENNSFMYQNAVSFLSHVTFVMLIWNCLVSLQSAPAIKKPTSHGHSHDSSQMNMRGAFLHVLSDALGSVIVVISALVSFIYFVFEQDHFEILYDVIICRLFG